MDDDNVGYGLVVMIVGVLICIVCTAINVNRIADALDRAYPNPAPAAEVNK
jgi:hypothetical protein